MSGRTRWLGLLGWIVAGALPASGAEPAARVSVSLPPEPVYAVPGDGVRKVNFDFLVRNEGEVAVDLVELRLEVRDAAGSFVTRRELNRQGMVASIRGVLTTEFAPGQFSVLFNPFHEFPATMELGTLKYTLVFEPKEKEGETAQGPAVEVPLAVRPEAYRPRTKMALPLKGKVWILDGFDFHAHHRRLDFAHPLLVQLGVRKNITRYGVDFVALDANGNRYRGSGKAREDYYAWDMEIRSPAAGTVADCVDGRPDNPVGQGSVDYDELLRTKNLKLLGGNYVIVDHGHGEFSYFAHVRNGSLQVRKGDRVGAGQVIGRVGNSGDSFEPHLHYQVLTGPELDGGVVPATFRDYYRYYGSRRERVTEGAPDTGDLIEAY